MALRHTPKSLDSPSPQRKYNSKMADILFQGQMAFLLRIEDEDHFQPTLSRYSALS